MYYYGARYYDAQTSVWLSVDPLADHPNQIDKSPYAAFWNNPIFYNDPTGLCPDCDDAMPDAEAGAIYRPEGAKHDYLKGDDGEWTMLGGMMDEVVVEHELSLQDRGDLWVKKNVKYSYADAERMVVEEKGYDYDVYKKMVDLKLGLEFPKGGNSTSHMEDLADMAIFINDYAKKHKIYNSFARDYTGILFSDQPLLKKVSQLRALMEAYEPPKVSQREIEDKFYELNPILNYLRDE